ncbi:MAG: hypothetical protein OXU81_06625 [Gammaproteobacteria bacterium]|nr:hypothetical protein [Gammaproteobacteria bacterium]
MKSFTMQLQGKLNDVKFTIHGTGSREPEYGIVHGFYDLTRVDGLTVDISGLDHWIFNCMIITGYPSETASGDNAENPFKERPYRYRRTVDFLERGAIELEANVDFTEKGVLASQFKVDGQVRVPPLKTVQPTIEAWVPLSERQVLGTFTMSWLSQDGDSIPGIATTYYELLENGPSLFSARHRRIEITADGTLWQFMRWQRSTMISTESGSYMHAG